MKKTTIFAAFLTVFAIVTAPLQADVITNWQFNVNSSFVSWLGQTDFGSEEVEWQQAKGETNPRISFNDDLNWMGWSSQDGRTSSLSLASNSGTITTDGDMQTALTMTHNNSVIGANSPAPKIMEIAIDVALTGVHANGDIVNQNLALTLMLGFMETPNKGSGMLDGHTQDDIFFIVSNPSTTQRFTDDFGNVYDVSMDAVFKELTGVHLDTAEYYIDERIGGYYNLSSLDTLYGWYTLEGKNLENAMDVNIVVRNETVPSTPEPGTMLIFAVAGAIGIPACRRLRKRTR